MELKEHRVVWRKDADPYWVKLVQAPWLTTKIIQLRGLTSRSWGVLMAERVERLNRYLRGWMNYFGISQHYSPIEELDGLTNEWLEKQGLLSIRSLWMKVQGYA